MEEKKIVIPKILFIIPIFVIGLSLVILLTMGIMDRLNEVNPIKLVGENNSATLILSGLANPKFNEWSFLPADKNIFDVLSDNEADGAIVNIFDLVQLNQKGLALTMVGLVDCPKDAHLFIADKSINTVGDLIEKKIGVSEVNSPGHYYLLQALRQNKVLEEDVAIESILKGSPIEAIKNNVVDAAYLPGQLKSAATEAGLHIISDNSQNILLGCSGLAVKNSLLKEKTKAIKKTLTAYFDFLDNSAPEKWNTLVTTTWPESFKAKVDQLKGVAYFDINANEKAADSRDDNANIREVLQSINEFSGNSEGDKSLDGRLFFSDKYF